MKRIILPLSMLVAVVVLLGAFRGGTEHAAQFVEDARGCDWFGYLRQAHLFRQNGPIGGLDTAIRDDRTRYLVGVAKATGLDPDVWDYGVAPYCHHYKPRTDRVVLQYPPGTGFVHALWPEEGRQARLTYAASGVLILAILLGVIATARAATVPLLAAALGLFCTLGMHMFVYDRSIPPSVVMALGLGWLTVVLAGTPLPSRRVLLAGALGLLIGLSASLRLPNILLAAGPLAVLGVAFIRRPSGYAAEAVAWHGVMAVIGLIPVLAANAINAGHPLATTYGSIDTSLPKIAWHELAQGFAYYFVEQKETAATTIVALLAVGAVLVTRKFLRFSGAGSAAAMAMVSLLVSIGFMVTHEPYTRYYLLPVAVYGLAVAVVCLVSSENARVGEPPAWRFAAAARLGLVAATLAVLAIMLRLVAMPLSPNYTAPDTTVTFDPKAIVWADRNTGNIVHFLKRQAAVFTFLPRDVRDRFVADIARDGVPQYFVVDSDYMENAVAPFRHHEGFRLVGKTFGHDTFVIEPRMHADNSAPVLRAMTR